jgi:hypothetical protein
MPRRVGSKRVRYHRPLPQHARAPNASHPVARISRSRRHLGEQGRSDGVWLCAGRRWACLAAGHGQHGLLDREARADFRSPRSVRRGRRDGHRRGTRLRQGDQRGGLWRMAARAGLPRSGGGHRQGRAPRARHLRTAGESGRHPRGCPDEPGRDAARPDGRLPAAQGRPGRAGRSDRRGAERGGGGRADWGTG